MSSEDEVGGSRFADEPFPGCRREVFLFGGVRFLALSIDSLGLTGWAAYEIVARFVVFVVVQRFETADRRTDHTMSLTERGRRVKIGILAEPQHTRKR